MAKALFLIEVDARVEQAFARHTAALASPAESLRQGESHAERLAGLGVEVVPHYAPVPLFAEATIRGAAPHAGFAAFASPTPNDDTAALSVVVTVAADRSRVADLRERSGVRGVFENSRLYPYEFDLVGPSGGISCRPFRPPASVWTIRTQLGVRPIWRDGYRGQGIAVGIIDEGIDGTTYPVAGGVTQPMGQAPGTAPITSHGSMCAADVLVAAPSAVLYDYPFLGIPNSGGALAMFQSVLEQRRRNGTPHLTSNSYGFISLPPRAQFPTHEAYDLNHPLHRKIREVIASGAACFFAAGNCGSSCPSDKCMPSAIGPGRSISGSNSLSEVIAVAAVNAQHEQLGYSAEGPGLFDPAKPDLAAYSHFLGNFGPGRPGGTLHSPFDNGTSASSPLAAGVGALLMGAFPALAPAALKAALTASALRPSGTDWNSALGFGILNAAAAYARLRSAPPAEQAA